MCVERPLLDLGAAGCESRQEWPEVISMPAQRKAVWIDRLGSRATFERLRRCFRNARIVP
jgi:hypothetical protein